MSAAGETFTLPNAADTFDADQLRTEIPEAMQQARRWLLWRYELPEQQGGKPRKVPYYATGHRRQGKLDTEADWSRLVTMAEALAAAERLQDHGLGFGLGPDGRGRHWQGIDLDGIDKRPEVAALVERLPGYIERSPSGNGVHAIGIGTPFRTLGSNDTGIEAYAAVRYFTVTAAAIGGDLEDLSGFVLNTLEPMHRRTPSANDSQATGESFFAKVNAKAMRSFPDWVPALFPKACEYHDGYRIASKDLGRSLEEDISIVSEGIKDFGEESGKTPLDLVIEWGPANNPKEAALWLCERMRIDPAALGWNTPAAKVEMAEEWPDPKALPTALLPVQPFDPDVLPDALRPWIEDIAERMQCPPDFPAVGAMAALSSVIGRKCVIQPKRYDDWQVVPNLWGMIVGRPGLMKSPALAAALNPLDRLAAEARQEYQVAKVEYDREAKFRAMSAKAADDQAAKLIKAGKAEEAKAMLAQADDEAAMDDPAPALRRYKVTDTTVEALGEILIENPWGVLAYRDELHGLLRSMEREGQESARSFYLQGYDGNQSYTTDRIIRGKNLHIDAVCIAMLGGIQPGRLKHYIRDATGEGSGDDGLLQRFGLLVWPDNPQTWRNVDRWPDTPAKTRAFDVFERLDAIQPSTDEAGKPAPAIYHFDAPAQDIFDSWRGELEALLRADSIGPAMESHLAKYRKLVPALALLCALADGSESVNEHALLRALAWAEYLRTHAERAYAAGQGLDYQSAEALLRKIRAKAVPDPFRPSDVYLKGWADLRDPQTVTQAARMLADLGHLARTETPSGPAGGRPSIRFRINPKTLRG